MEPHFERALALACAYLDDRTFIRFPVTPREDPSQFIAVWGPVRLFRRQSVELGMHAQIVNRTAAERLREATQRFDRPVDSFMQFTWVHQANVRCLIPSGIREISIKVGGSSTQRSLPLLFRVCLELVRSIFRGRHRLSCPEVAS